MKTLLCLLAAMATLAALPQPVHADTLAVSTFDAGADGWSALSVKANANDDHPIFDNILQDYAVTWSVTGGYSGGAISESDQDSGWQYFSASSAFLGDQTAAIGGTLTFELLRTDRNTSFPGQDGPALALTNGKTVLVSTAAGGPSTNGWTSYSFSLSAASLFVTSDTGKQATDKQLNKVLSDLTGVYILSDWYTGIGDSYSLDNVVLSSASANVPEPASWVLLLTGGSAFLAFRRRRIV